MHYKIAGTVDCDTCKEIEEGARFELMVFDGAIGCGPMRVAGTRMYEGVTSLPFNFELEYNDDYFAERLDFGPAISCQIKQGDQLLFYNDARLFLWDKETNKLLDHIQVPVRKLIIAEDN